MDWTAPSRITKRLASRRCLRTLTPGYSSQPARISSISQARSRSGARAFSGTRPTAQLEESTQELRWRLDHLLVNAAHLRATSPSTTLCPILCDLTCHHIGGACAQRSALDLVDLTRRANEIRCQHTHLDCSFHRRRPATGQ